MRRGRSALLALGFAILGPAARAQAPTPPPLVIETEVYVVSLTAVVHDKAGRFVGGLVPQDVEVLEDGVRQDLIYFHAAGSGQGAEKIPLSVVLVLDASGSMKQNLGFLQEAAVSFVRKLDDVDQAMVVSFNETIKGSAEFSPDPARLEDLVDALQAWGGTSLYDAIHYALGRVKDQPGRKALVVFSDGADTTSSLQERDVVDYAKAVEATIYAVGIEGVGPGGGAPRGFLKRIAQETGGLYFFPERVGELIKTFAQISDELHNHYALAYTPRRAPGGAWRAISVRLPGRPDAVVRVRKGYFAVARRRAAAR